MTCFTTIFYATTIAQPQDEKATSYRPQQFAGAKDKVTLRKVREVRRGPPGRGPPGRGPPGRGGPPARGGGGQRGPPGRGGGGPPGRGGPGGGGGRGGPPAMVDVLNPELAQQLAVAQSAGNEFSPGHSTAGDFNPSAAKQQGPPRGRGPPGRGPPGRGPPPAQDYYSYDYPAPKAKPKRGGFGAAKKGGAVLKSAGETPDQPEDPNLEARLLREQEALAEEAAIAERAEQEFRNSFIMPGLMLVVGLVILAYVIRNKQKIDAEKAKKRAIENENVSSASPPENTELVADEEQDPPKSPEDAKKIEEIYKEQPLPVNSHATDNRPTV